jgi:hypothetical protein
LRWRKKRLKIFSPGWPAVSIFVAGKVNSGACLILILPGLTIYLAHIAEKTCFKDYPQNSWENYGRYWLIIGRKTRYEVRTLSSVEGVKQMISFSITIVKNITERIIPNAKE